MSAVAAEDSDVEEGMGGGWEAGRARRRPLPPAESDYSEQSEDDPEERRRSLRPRRARQHGEEYLLELRGVAGGGASALAAAAAGEEEPAEAGAYDSDGGERCRGTLWQRRCGGCPGCRCAVWAAALFRAVQAAARELARPPDLALLPRFCPRQAPS